MEHGGGGGGGECAGSPNWNLPENSWESSPPPRGGDQASGLSGLLRLLGQNAPERRPETAHASARPAAGSLPSMEAGEGPVLARRWLSRCVLTGPPL